ncbi:MAG: TetR/AcrR family transcriptional regulator [Pseudorhodoplanes sp.]|uniref:TetR/AcrR family transcriptional regulator n=1 Tax=Pseudorhodoplanes sp. TaxID=1934341 RepID=UPI003D112C1C
MATRTSKKSLPSRERAGVPAPRAEGQAAAQREKPRSAREVRSAARREAILAAALDEFSAQGFAAARLDDVAKRAGVAKGTIYLYFADKETLFQELVRSMLTPVIGKFEALALIDIPFSDLAERLVDVAVREVFNSRRKDIIRLIISEGPRFPAIAEFYYREVLSRVFSALQQILQRAFDRGEIRHRGLVAFPQLLAAPVLVGIVWTSLFDKQAPLDARAMLKAHVDILLDRGSES